MHSHVTIHRPIKFEINEVQPQLTDLKRALLFMNGQRAGGSSVEERRVRWIWEIGMILGGYGVAGSRDWKSTMKLRSKESSCYSVGSTVQTLNFIALTGTAHEPTSTAADRDAFQRFTRHGLVARAFHRGREHCARHCWGHLVGEEEDRF